MFNNDADNQEHLQNNYIDYNLSDLYIKLVKIYSTINIQSLICKNYNEACELGDCKMFNTYCK